MEKLSEAYLASCRREEGRILRGEQMTRTETFVDAAFAFALTMLVISIDEIPRSAPELLELSRDLPSFILSALIVGSIWLAHSRWSRIFGLQDHASNYLSLALVILVLIFVYPIKLMMQLAVVYFSGGTLGPELPPMVWIDVVHLLVYFSTGVIALSVIIILLYRNALRFREELSLTPFEVFYCRRISLIWIVVAATAIASCVIALVSSQTTVVWAAYVYFTLVITLTALELYLRRHSPAGADSRDAPFFGK